MDSYGWHRCGSGFDSVGYLVVSSAKPSLTRGDRVRIKEGYDGAGDVFYYGAKSSAESGMVLLFRDQACGDEAGVCLADAIEPHPYTREERIERAIEDIYEAAGWGSPNVQAESDSTDADYRALLFAFLDAGV